MQGARGPLAGKRGRRLAVTPVFCSPSVRGTHTLRLICSQRVIVQRWNSSNITLLKWYLQQQQIGQQAIAPEPSKTTPTLLRMVSAASVWVWW